MDTSFEMQTLEQLKAFSHPVRYQVINLLIVRPMTGSQLARILKMPRQRLHYHLKLLKQLGLILTVNAPENQTSVEIYYRSVAENFSSALLGNVISMPAGDITASDDLRLQTLHDLVLTMTEQVKIDLKQRNARQKLSRLSSPFQHSVFLTPEQVAEAHTRFQEIKKDLLSQSERNMAAGDQKELTGIRYTLLVTPAYAGDDDE